LTSEYPLAKGADFGQSTKFYDNLTYEQKSRELDPWKWMAYKYLISDFVRFTSDVCSFQEVVWEFVSFVRLPCGQQSYKEVLDQLEKGCRLPCPNKVSYISSWSPKTIYNKLATVCFVSDAIVRAHFSQIVEIIESGLSQKEQTLDKEMAEKYKTNFGYRYLVN
jgi:hypothetical protein